MLYEGDVRMKPTDFTKIIPTEQDLINQRMAALEDSVKIITANLHQRINWQYQKTKEMQNEIEQIIAKLREL